VGRSHTLLSFEGASYTAHLAPPASVLGPGSAVAREAPPRPPNRSGSPGQAGAGTGVGNLENYIASASIFAGRQVTKGTRWMPWRQEPMKDVGGCDKPRGAANQASIRGSPNGETRHGSCRVTPV
jgi:hypothetical protein